MVYNKVYAQIGEERHITLDPVNYQYDVKQILVISGETVPDYYEADVCNVGDTATLTMIGTAADGVEIPDKFLLDGRNVLVYVVIPGSGGDVQTRYDITIPVDERAEREDIDPSEAEQKQIDSLINALNSGVERAEAAATAAEESATDAEGSAGESEDQAENAEAWAVGQRAGTDVDVDDQTYHNNSKYYAGMAEAAAEEAGRHEASWESWVRRAENAADDAEGSARAAAGAKADAEAAAKTANKKAAAAESSATEAENSAREAAQTVAGGVGAINTARDGALTAIGRAGTTQTGAVNQAGADQVTAVNQAGATQVQAVEDKGDEVLNSIPQDYSDLVDDVDDLSRQLSDETIETVVDVGTLVDGYYVEQATGAFLPYGGWSRTDYIDCSDWVYVRQNSGSAYNAFYDENKIYVGACIFTANINVQIPSNAKYVVFSRATAEFANLVCNAGVKSVVSKIDAEIDDIKNIVETEITIHPNALITNALITRDGDQVGTASYVCTDYLDLPFDEISNIVVIGTFNGTAGCAIYDASRNCILGIDGNNVANYGGRSSSGIQAIVVPHQSGMHYIRITGYAEYVGDDPNKLGVIGNTLAGAFERIFDVEQELRAVASQSSSAIPTSKVLVIGDSISTDVYGSYPKWVTDLIGEGFLPSNTTNSSQHATGFVARYNSEANDFISRLKAIQNPSQYDLVVVFGGINDYIQSVPMGSESGTDYTVSFKPAVNEFFTYLIQNFTQARLCVLLPLRTYATWQNSAGEYQQAYGDYIKQVAKSYCLPVLNLTEESGFCPYISTFSEMWTLIPEGYQSGDGVHPNAEYERRFLAPMIKRFLQGLM